MYIKSQPHHKSKAKPHKNVTYAAYSWTTEIILLFVQQVVAEVTIR